MDAPGADRAEIIARLEELEAEERQVSAERRRLHDRLNAFYNEAAAQREAELSRRRKELHLEIDALRVKVGRARADPCPEGARARRLVLVAR